MISSAAKFAIGCKCTETPCPHQTNPWNCVDCGGNFRTIESAAGEPMPDGWLCDTCEGNAKVAKALESIGDDPLEVARFWLGCEEYDWQYGCGDGIHNVDVEWLVEEIDRLRIDLGDRQAEERLGGSK